MNQDSEESESDGDSSEDEETRKDTSQPEIYRPPKLAPMPYNEPSRNSKSNRRAPVPIALAQISALARNPHIESTSGTGAAPPALQSARAKELARITEFEEENFTRIVLKKSEAKRRKRDEADIALGGTGASAEHRGRRAGAGLEDEFADVLRAVDRKGRGDGKVGDGYEVLRERGRKQGVLERARKRRDEDVDGEETRERKKGRFEKSRLALKKKAKGRR
jgi:U3 small nucleolar ribonucleoprotein protein LCP5